MMNEDDVGFDSGKDMEEDMESSKDYIEDENEQNKSSEDEDDELEAKHENELKLNFNSLQKKLSENPYDYNSHVQLIETASALSDLDKLRKARQDMSSKFPLTPLLWLRWIQDEEKIASSIEEKEQIIKLFETAIQDYVSLDIWLEYVQFMIGLIEKKKGLELIRQTFEKALKSIGLHVSKGALIWESYREFEMALIDMVPAEEKTAQCKRIFELFKRQLSVPLFEMEKTFQEFEDWCSTLAEKCSECELEPKSIRFIYEKALSQLQKLRPYEDSLISSKPPHFEEYLKYIEFEEANGTPPRVQCIYERAILDNCLIPDLWIKYTQYLDKKVNITDLIFSVYERSLRNCPWSVNLWINYLEWMEKNKYELNEVIQVFERSLLVGFQTSEEYRQIWLAYLNYLRRHTNWDDEKQIESLRKNFQTCIQHLDNMENGDPNALFPFYLAKIEAKYCNNLIEARNYLNSFFKERKDISTKAQMWLEFANFERIFGDEKHYKKVLLQGLQNVQDWPETIGNVLIKYEQEEGSSIQEYTESMEKYLNALEKINERRLKEAKKEELKRTKFDKKTHNRKRKEPLPSTSNSDQFSNPPLFSLSPSDLIKDEKIENKKVKFSSTATKDEYILNEMKRQSEIKGSQDEMKILNTVFVSNLDFKLDENYLQNVFSKFGRIVDIRLVRNFKGLSKGYCYIEYDSIEGAKEALKHDRMMLESRPAFVSEMGKRSGFKFKTGVEQNKLFISNLSPDVNAKMLTHLFEKYGKLKDVRIVTYRNGHSKGCAYVEFLEESTATSALAANGTLLLDRNIKVAISDPSSKLTNQNNTIQKEKVLGAGLFHSFISRNQAKRKIEISFKSPNKVK